MNLPAPIEHAVAPLLQTLPLEEAMVDLVPSGPQPAASEVVAELVREAPLRDRPDLLAGLWLYADELDKSHHISQGLHDATGSFWHAIMHRREGDFSNSHYWFRRTGEHPAMSLVGPHYDPHQFIDEVEQAHRRGESPAELVDRQRREWARLFEWCASQPT